MTTGWWDNPACDVVLVVGVTASCGPATAQAERSTDHGVPAVIRALREDRGSALSTAYLAVARAQERGDRLVLAALRDSMAAIVATHPDPYVRGKVLDVLTIINEQGVPLPIEQHLQLLDGEPWAANRTGILAAMGRHPDRAGVITAYGRVARRRGPGAFDQLVALEFLDSVGTQAAWSEIMQLEADSTLLHPQVLREVRRLVQRGPQPDRRP